MVQTKRLECLEEWLLRISVPRGKASLNRAVRAMAILLVCCKVGLLQLRVRWVHCRTRFAEAFKVLPSPTRVAELAKVVVLALVAALPLSTKVDDQKGVNEAS